MQELYPQNTISKWTVPLGVPEADHLVVESRWQVWAVAGPVGPPAGTRRIAIIVQLERIHFLLGHTATFTVTAQITRN